jgi:RNA 3'-terminal phosphate cyclase (ATP)
MIELDGSSGEGGGQILRSSLALSLLTGKPFHLADIRARRDKPGLRPQHLMSVRAAAAVGRATVHGDSLGSRDLVFKPGAVQSGNYEVPIGTAGATGLVLHTLYLPLALAGGGPSRLTFVGGTHVPHSPCFHFLDMTWRRYLEIMGLNVTLDMRRPGFYPRGGGIVDALIEPVQGLRGLRLTERGPLKRATGFSAVAGLPESIAQRQADQAMSRLAPTKLRTFIPIQHWDDGPGTVLAIILETTPVPTFFFGLGGRGKRAERVADEAADQALAYLDAGRGVVDPHSADQIALPLALTEGASEYSVSAVTEHLLTNVAVIKRFIDRPIDCEGALGEPGLVRVR